MSQVNCLSPRHRLSGEILARALIILVSEGPAQGMVVVTWVSVDSELGLLLSQKNELLQSPLGVAFCSGRLLAGRPPPDFAVSRK